MALDETTEKLYRAADTATLLALVPLIQTQTARWKTELESVTKIAAQSADADAQIWETCSEALARLDSRFGDDPKDQAALQSIRDSLSASMQKLQAGEDRLASYSSALLTYLIQLTEREQWIVAEMIRRGYLPAFPGEESFL